MTATLIGSMFSGAGGLDIAVEDVFDARTVWHCELEDAPSKVLAARWPGVPNLRDVTKVDWSQVEPVDVICGGSPCQDVSSAGKRAGMRAGTRSGLWASMCDAVDIIRPGLVVWENVRGVLSAEADSGLEPCPGCVGDPDDGAVLRALGRVLGDLADVGYDARWCGLRAADVGAPHGRFRVFVVAWPSAGHAGHRAGSPEQRVAPHVATGCAGESGGGAAADAESVGHERGGIARGRRDGSADSGDLAADAEGEGRQRPRPEPTRSGPERSGRTAADAVCGGRDGRTPLQVGGPVRGTAAARPRPHPAPHTVCDGRDERRPEPARLVGGPEAPFSSPRPAPDTGGERLGEHTRESPAQETGPVSGDEPSGDRGSRAAVDWGPYLPAIERWQRILGRLAPPPTELAPKGGQRLSPRFVEFMMGLPDGWVTDVPGITRNDQLKILGNGVVPAQAAAALRILLNQSEAAA